MRYDLESLLAAIARICTTQIDCVDNEGLSIHAIFKAPAKLCDVKRLFQHSDILWERCKFERDIQQVVRGVGVGTLPSASKRPMRGPITHAPARAARPPVIWTTPQPAKSITPVPSNLLSDGLIAEAQPVTLHTPADVLSNHPCMQNML